VGGCPKKPPLLAQLNLELTEGTKMRDLIERLGMPLEKKGITFIN
jgi:hypothetical protein